MSLARRVQLVGARFVTGLMVGTISMASCPHPLPPESASERVAAFATPTPTHAPCLSRPTPQAVPLYLSEVAPTELRGSLGAVNQFGVTLGILAAYVAGLAVQRRQLTDVACADDRRGADGGGSAAPSLTLYGVTTYDLACGELVSGWTCEPSSGDAGAPAGETFACKVRNAAARI
jgi:hypothetical protein